MANEPQLSSESQQTSKNGVVCFTNSALDEMVDVDINSNAASDDGEDCSSSQKSDKKKKSEGPVAYFKQFGFREGMRWIFKNVTIEPFVFMTMFSCLLTMTPNIFLLYKKVCHVEQGYDLEMCQEILFNESHRDSEEKVKLQSDSATWKIITTLIALIPGIFIKLLAGSWSDRYGRKPLLYLILVGVLIRNALFMLNIYFIEAKVLWLVLSQIPAATFDYNLLYPISLAYIADIADESNRSIRYVVMEYFLLLGFFVGQLSGGYIVEEFGYYAVYGIGMLSSLLSIFYLIFFVKETKGTKTENVMETLKKYGDFFNFKNIKEAFQVLSVKREGRTRLHIILLVIVSVLQSSLRYCNRGIDDLYTQRMYQWTPSQTSTVNALILFIDIMLFAIVSIILMKKMKLSQTTLMLIGFASSSLGYAITGISYDPWLFWFGGIITFLSGLPDVIMQTSLSTLVNKNEIGKVMTVRSALCAMAGPESSIAFVAIYKATLNFYVGFAYLLTSVLYIFPVGVYLIVHFKPTNIEHEDGIKKNGTTLQGLALSKVDGRENDDETITKL